MKAKVVATSNKRTSQDIKKRGTQALAKKKQQKNKTKERNMQTTTLL